jgi:hypothetical protein
MKRKGFLVLLAVILLALVCLSPTGEVGPVSAQGLIEYGFGLAVKYDALLFSSAEWNARVEGGCVIYELKASDEDPATAEYYVLLAQELREEFQLGTDPLPFAAGAKEVVTACDDTVHLRALPVSSATGAFLGR